MTSKAPKAQMKTNNTKTLIVLTGPTAVGKTRLAVELAQWLQTDILSADARQFYHGLRIGTAAPALSEMHGVRHHFVGQLQVTDPYNVSMFEKEALALLERLFRGKDLVLLTGGSGLYLDVLCQGMDPMPAADPLVRERVQAVFRQDGLPGLRRWLKSIDPAYYGEVDPANPKRIMRGIEVFLTAGVPYSSLRKGRHAGRPFNIKRVVLERPRQELFARINQRVDRMIADGLIEEAMRFYAYRHLNALNTVGYKEIYEWIANRFTLSEAVSRIKTNSRRYAKRQMAWFRRYTDALRVHPDDGDAIRRFIHSG